MRKKILAIAALPVTLVAAGCTATSDWEAEVTDWTVDMLEADTATLTQEEQEIVCVMFEDLTRDELLSLVTFGDASLGSSLEQIEEEGDNITVNEAIAQDPAGAEAEMPGVTDIEFPDDVTFTEFFDVVVDATLDYVDNDFC